MSEQIHGGATPADGRPDGRADMAGQAKQTAQDQAKQLGEAAKARVRGEAERRQGQASQTLEDFAQALNRAADELSGRDQSMGAQLARQAADALADLSRSIGDKRPEDMLHGVRDFGRENPTGFFAASVLVGLGIGRVAGSSAERRRQEDDVSASDEALTAAAEVGGTTARAGTGSLYAGTGVDRGGAATPTALEEPSIGGAPPYSREPRREI